jgi:NitT/TauT family transport system ATP-binding protein
VPVTAPGPERGMVFQEYALFPWMTVEQNVGFGLEIKGSRARRSARAWPSC